jgi:hypothetical protein
MGLEELNSKYFIRFRKVIQTPFLFRNKDEDQTPSRAIWIVLYIPFALTTFRLRKELQKSAVLNMHMF